MSILPQALSDQREQRMIVSGVSWQQYESLLTTLADHPELRLSYLEGTLEIFMPSSEQEMLKKTIARLLERYVEEMDIALHGYGSTTFRRQAKARGIEPDECYCVGTLKDVPDFAIEVNLTSGGIDKLAIYQGLDVPEVLIWEDDRLTLYDLRLGAVQVSDRSQFFPNLDWHVLAQFIFPNDQPRAVKEFLQAVRS